MAKKKKSPQAQDVAMSVARPGVGAAVRSFIQGSGGSAAGIGSVALPAAGIAAGGIVGANQISGISNAIQGEDLSLLEEGSLAPLTGGASFAFDKFRKSEISKEGDKRHSTSKAFQSLGLWDEAGNTVLADGSIANSFKYANNREFKNADKRKDNLGEGRKLEAYEIDYTNDLDYTAGMAGITLSRLLGGGKEKHIDQNGNLIGNQMLGNVGYGKEMSQENFSKTMKNARAMYAQAGIQSKDEMLGLANQMFAQERISDADYAVMQQTAGLVFDNDYNTAQSLMSGRHDGINTASKTPSGQGASVASARPGITDPRSREGFVYSNGAMTPEEVQMAIAPSRASYERAAQNFTRGMESRGGAADIATGLGAAGAIAGGISKIPGAGGFISDAVSGIGDLLGFGAGGDELSVTPEAITESFDIGSGAADYSDLSLDSILSF